MSAASAAPLRFTSCISRTSSFARTSRQLQCLNGKRWSPAPSGYVRNVREIGQKAFANNTPKPWTRTIIKEQRRLAATSTQDPLNANVTTEESLQPYKPPTTGLLAQLPATWVPYAELIRLDKPTGTYYLFLPCLFSTLLAAPLADPIASPLTVLSTSALFFTGALVMRGAGCTVNDLWDRNLDPHVSRTRLRPIARGAVTVQQAIPYLGAQLLTGLVVLLQFPTSCLFYGVPSLIFVAAYPLAKRVTNYPQFVLGLTFSWGAMMGFPALGIDLLSNTPALISAGCLYASCVAWTIVYDMIYAYQDIRDDVKAGIKSIARAQEVNGKYFLSAVATLQVGLLAGAGVAVGAGPAFYIGTCGGAAATLGYMIRKVDLKSPRDCWAWFVRGAWFTGGAISVGLGGEYLFNYLGLYDGKEASNEREEMVV